MAISLEEVYKIAHLCRLEFNEEEAKVLTEELSKILDYFKKLQTVNTENVAPTFHTLKVKTPFREDEVKEFPYIEDILKNAPQLYERMIIVPKVVKTP
ncbi:MAG: Asp-tRNA(Asn)/Glu-tRNA(Gln) amidotransferase subunit GatC [Thermodesulfobacterium sp.]|nr:Asp-tRNA(Asn)/Glu-tRNA(Gln) amidotransferase subunit GatC [Thermodesulfobacterium sp.]MCD6548625.1 Asp-tRNA(Asn)/Glu-tRNA(Gln) amidotransferase subunit GatC [Thermodesulfobacterium sp.]HEA84241.1 Asp-tRNA(Asn)/Glu-tRNA(Gln) amidotransferase subunit GatC [Thermodesulfobacterium geofontis]